jgi:hypothetical protein
MEGGQMPTQLKIVDCVELDWFNKIIREYNVAWHKREHDRIVAAIETQRADDAFAVDAVKHRRDTTDSKAVFDRCNDWLGRRS